MPSQKNPRPERLAGGGDVVITDFNKYSYLEDTVIIILDI